MSNTEQYSEWSQCGSVFFQLLFVAAAAQIIAAQLRVANFVPLTFIGASLLAKEGKFPAVVELVAGLH